MEVDDFNSIVFAGQQFEKTAETSETDDQGVTTTTYVFSHEVDVSELYPGGDLGDILIRVERGQSLADGDKVTVRIPASLIPVRYYNMETENGVITSGNITDTYPIRVFYSVSVKDGVETLLNTGSTDANAEEYAALMAYISENRDADGANVYFYSNAYDDSSEKGLTTATFTPNANNSFYYFTEDTTLYTMQNGGYTPVTSANISEDATYYYPKTVYRITGQTVTEETEWVEVSGRNVASAYASGDIVRNWSYETWNYSWTITSGTQKMTREDFVAAKDTTSADGEVTTDRGVW